MPRRPAMYYPDYGPLLPTSGPDWRWARALELVSSGRNASLKRDGPDIVRAISFIRRSFRDVTGKETKRLLKEDPNLVLAIRLANEAGRRQLELHCRVLANQSSGVIAVELGLTKSIVETYCLMFFDVPERLGAKSYILQRVIGMPLNGPSAPETLMMASSYFHGPHVIEPWLDYLDHQGEAHDLTTAEGRMRESIELFLLAHGLNFDAPTNTSLVKRFRFIYQTRSKMFRKRSIKQVVSENVSKKLGEIFWRPSEERGVPAMQASTRPISGASRQATSRTA